MWMRMLGGCRLDREIRRDYVMSRGQQEDFLRPALVVLPIHHAQRLGSRPKVQISISNI